MASDERRPQCTAAVACRLWVWRIRIPICRCSAADCSSTVAHIALSVPRLNFRAFVKMSRFRFLPPAPGPQVARLSGVACRVSRVAVGAIGDASRDTRRTKSVAREQWCSCEDHIVAYSELFRTWSRRPTPRPPRPRGMHFHFPKAGDIRSPNSGPRRLVLGSECPDAELYL